MDRAYEDNETRALVVAGSHNPIIQPNENRRDTWEYGK
jgi:hypothetical protein